MMRRGRALLILAPVALVGLMGGALSCADARAPSQAAAQPPAEPAPAEEAPAADPVEENSENSEEAENNSDNSAEPEVDSDVPCPATALRLGHRSLSGVPARLGQAIARVSEDLRAIEVVVGSARPSPDGRGHFPRPSAGQARFEFEAVRTYRRNAIPLGPLGSPESRQGGLRHPRVLLHDGSFTFSERRGREMGQVTLTHLDAERVCGRVSLDDGFGRVEGPFTATVVGPLPD